MNYILFVVGLLSLLAHIWFDIYYEINHNAEHKNKILNYTAPIIALSCGNLINDASIRLLYWRVIPLLFLIASIVNVKIKSRIAIWEGVFLLIWGYLTIYSFTSF